MGVGGREQRAGSRGIGSMQVVGDEKSAYKHVCECLSVCVCGYENLSAGAGDGDGGDDDGGGEGGDGRRKKVKL